MSIWLEQKDCTILKHGNLLLGFCQRDTPDTEGMITFFYPTREEVDTIYEKFKERSNEPPKENPRYQIYHSFAKDPEDRTLEFQHFMHPLKPI
ncbi:MAG: VOC family protein [Candidatus Wukongarchaeota archaeon]|nr:VOC family protein [Candidatus Wukongarchaeota archaeon]